jgi:hypothetical protein
MGDGKVSVLAFGSVIVVLRILMVNFSKRKISPGPFSSDHYFLHV